MSTSRDDAVRTPSRQAGIKSYNEALERLKTVVNYLLGEKLNGKAVFYHVKTCNVEEIVQHVFTLKAANFTRKMSFMRNATMSEQSDLHKEVMMFLKSKCLHDGGEELKTEKEVDEHGETFVLACSEAVGGMVEIAVK